MSSEALTEIMPSMEPTPENFSRLRAISQELLEAGIIQETQLQIYEERLLDLELEQEDLGWVKMIAEGENEFSLEGRRRMIRMSRMMYLKNPLVLRSVEIQANYVFGQGVSIQGRHNDIDSVIQGFLDDHKNRSELTSQQARLSKEKELQTDGGIYFVFFVDKKTGATRLRSIPVTEIEDTICDPNDSKTPWFYKRVWQSRQFDIKTGKTETKTKTAFYPAFRYNPEEGKRPKTVGKGDSSDKDGWPIEWDAPVYHVKVGGFSDWAHGVPETYAMIDWSRQYKDFLMDWATITKAYARFAFKSKQTKGGKKQVKAAASKLEKIMAGDPQEGTGQGFVPPIPQRATPPAGTLVEGENSDLSPMKTAGATTSAADGRYLRLMAASASGFPETFFGDADVGNHATATTLNRPTELMCRNRQFLWIDVFRDILTYVVLQAVKAPQGKLRNLGTVIMNADREESVKWKKVAQENPDTGKTETKEPNAQIDVDFPEIVEIDVPGRVDAIVSAEPLIPDKKLVTRWLLRAFGEDDIDEMIRAMYAELERQQAAAAKLEQQSRPEGARGGTATAQGGGGTGTRGPAAQAQPGTAGRATAAPNQATAPATRAPAAAPAAQESADEIEFEQGAYSVEIDLSEDETISDDVVSVVVRKLIESGKPDLSVGGIGTLAPFVEHGGQRYGILDNVVFAESGAGAVLTLGMPLEGEFVPHAPILAPRRAAVEVAAVPSGTVELSENTKGARKRLKKRTEEKRSEEKKRKK